MFQSTRWLWAFLMIGGAMPFAGTVNGQDQKPAAKHDASALNLALRDVINAGATIFNDNGDHAGCFRMYQGSLLSVKPFVAPDLQKKIEAGLAKCEQLSSYADRAHELRKVLDEIRERTKQPADAKSPSENKDKEKAKDKDKDKDKETGEVTGKVTINGKPVADGYSAVLVSPNGIKFSAFIQNDGTFQIKTPIPVGEYPVAIRPLPRTRGSVVPARYTDERTSGLAIRVQPGKQDLELNLMK
jgi:hypothetical protein